MFWTRLLALVALSWVTCARQDPDSIYQSELFMKMMNDLRNAYNQKQNNLNHRRVAEQQTRIEELERRLEEQERKYSRLEKLLAGSSRTRRLVDTEPQHKVAFFAQLTNDLTGVGDSQTIVFDLAVTNIGNAYNKFNGMFTAPVSGTYAFSWTTASAELHHMQTELVVNNKMVGLTWSDAGEHNDYAIASDTAVLHLAEGDSVWVRSNTVHWHTLHGQKMTTFSGWLLYAD